jgi:methionyl-tRNA formyltransferase
LNTVRGIENDSLTPFPQDNSKEIQHAPKIFKDDCKINWNNTLDEIHYLVRGLSPYPAAWTTLQNKNFKIYKTKKEAGSHIYTTGKMLSDGKTYLKVAVNGGFLHLTDIQIEGKKRMPATEFLKGYNVEGLSFQ